MYRGEEMEVRYEEGLMETLEGGQGREGH